VNLNVSGIKDGMTQIVNGLWSVFVFLGALGVFAVTLSLRADRVKQSRFEQA